MLSLMFLSAAYFLLVSSKAEQAVLQDKNGENERNLEKNPIANVLNHGDSEPAHLDEDRTVADELSKKVRVLCWVLTHPDNHQKKAKIVKATWGKRCNKLLFMSSVEDPTLPSVKLPVKERRDYLWPKTKEAFKYIYERHRWDADWFLKADDDTYVIVENLRYLLGNYNPDDPIYFGCLRKEIPQKVFMSGGAGYVLSRRALQIFVTQGLPQTRFCSTKLNEEEDVEISACLERIGVKPLDDRDSLGRGRFYYDNPKKYLQGKVIFSDRAISFHYMEPHEMYVYDYLIYHLQPYGIEVKNSELQRL